MLCAPWIAADSPYICCEVEDPGDGSGVSVLAMEQAILEASHLLYPKSGRQFPGICEDTIRPCSGCAGGVQYLAYAGGGSRPIATGGPGVWGAHQCSCGGLGGIGCAAPGIALPGRPVTEVGDVTIDGVTLAETEYRLVDGYVLMRVGGGWPAHQDLALAETEDHTFSVTYSYGAVPDPAGLAAVAALACSIRDACNPGSECDLPEGLQQIIREGVTMEIEDPDDVLGGKGFGIAAVDRWLDAVNPAGLDRPAKMFSTGTIGNQHR